MVIVVQYATALAKVLWINSAPAFLSWPANLNVLPPLPMSLGLVRLLVWLTRLLLGDQHCELTF